LTKQGVGDWVVKTKRNAKRKKKSEVNRPRNGLSSIKKKKLGRGRERWEARAGVNRALWEEGELSWDGKEGHQR